jgi:sterol desaturase/sphingolipid hydroxylase (fatty acid hydroxylase superfamily)
MEQLDRVFTWLFTNYDPALVVTLGTFLLHEIGYFGLYIPYLIADRIPSMRKYKIQPDKQNTFSLHWRCFLRLLVLHTIAEIPMMWAGHYIFSYRGMKMVPPMPTWWSVFLHVVLFFLIEDAYFYWIHRLLHWGPFYKHIHKVHHEHNAPFGIAAEYAHPVETVFLGIGTVLGPILFASHIFTVWVWLFFRLWQELDAHSGYNFPWSANNWVPFWGGAEFHDYHHMSFVGNFASTFTYWDKWMGTDTKYFEWKSKLGTEKKSA